MGRRISFHLAIVFSVALLTPAVRAQTQAPESAPVEPAPVTPAPSEIHLALPDDLPPPSVAAPASEDSAIPKTAARKKTTKPVASNPSDARKNPAQKEPAEPGAVPQADSAVILPAISPNSFTPAASLPAPGAVTAEPAPLDDSVMRTQAAGAAAGTPPAPAPASATDGNSTLPPPGTKTDADRLQLGKQSVAVTVEVQSPPIMNLNQVATLKVIVKNIGSSDALNVVVNDILPEGLEFESSQTGVTPINGRLTWNAFNLAAGTDRVITFKVRPTQAGSFDHAATVTFLTGSKSRTFVKKPQLKVDQVVSAPKVLRGQQVEFKVAVTNVGTGTARNVSIQAKLSPGLRPGTVKSGDDHMMYELTLPELAEGQREELDPLLADALLGGEQSCTVIATSPDVIPHNKETAENVKTISVVEPKLKVALSAPVQRFTDSVAPYKITLENPGTAPARKVRLVVTLPVSGRLVAKPSDASYDSSTRRLQWNVDQLDPSGKPQTFNFNLRVGGVGYYEITAEARGEGGLSQKDRRTTEVVGMPDVDLVVSERNRVVEVGAKTVFQIKLTNYGTKEATNIQIDGKLSPNLKLLGTGGLDGDQAWANKDGKFTLPVIEKLGAGKFKVLAIEVQVQGDQPQLGTCKVEVKHDDLTEPFEDMSFIKIMSSRRLDSPNP